MSPTLLGMCIILTSRAQGQHLIIQSLETRSCKEPIIDISSPRLVIKSAARRMGASLSALGASVPGDAPNRLGFVPARLLELPLAKTMDELLVFEVAGEGCDKHISR